MSSARDTELRIPPELIEAARAKHPCEQTDEDWHQCDAVSCGRWYQTNRPVAIQLYSTAKPEGGDSASFTVAVYELRWACPACSGSVNGQDLGHMDAFHAPERNKHKHQAPCDWCRNLELDACDKKQHDKNEWDAEDDVFDFKATGIRLPPNWVGGYRTRSTDLSTYKVYLMFCRTCGEVLQPDRPDRFLRHMNARGRDAGARACLVPELDYLLQHTPGSARADTRPALDPTQPVVAAPELEEVFKFKPRNELAHIAAQLHWDMVKAISQDEEMREHILADVEDPVLKKRLKKYADDMMLCAEGDGDKPPRQRLQVKHKTGRVSGSRKRKSGTDAAATQDAAAQDAGEDQAAAAAVMGSQDDVSLKSEVAGSQGTAKDGAVVDEATKEVSAKQEVVMEVDRPGPVTSTQPASEAVHQPPKKKPHTVLDLGGGGPGSDRRVDSRGAHRRKTSDSAAVGAAVAAAAAAAAATAAAGLPLPPVPAAEAARALGGNLGSPRAVKNENSSGLQPGASGQADGDSGFQLLLDAAIKAAAAPSGLGSPGSTPAFVSPQPPGGFAGGGGSTSHKAKQRGNAAGGLQPQLSLINPVQAAAGATVPKERAPRGVPKQVLDLQMQVCELQLQLRELSKTFTSLLDERDGLLQQVQDQQRDIQEQRKERLMESAARKAEQVEHRGDLARLRMQLKQESHEAEMALIKRHKEEVQQLTDRLQEKLEAKEQEQGKVQQQEKQEAAS